jgi:HNH endonuclease
MQTRHQRHYTRAFIAALLTLALATMLASFAEARDQSQVRAFKKESPCPATGRSKGRCPGWQVDHRIPLKCGGADRPANMQWLTVQDHKIKTAREARLCRKPRR